MNATVMHERAVLPSGRVRLHSRDCTFLFDRLKPGVLLVTIVGHDKGQFGAAALEEMRLELARGPRLELHCDLRRTFNADPSVSEQWAAWFSANRASLAGVSILVASRFVHMTISVAKLFSRTGELIRIYTEQRPFEEAIARSLGMPFMLDAAERCRDL